MAIKINKDVWRKFNLLLEYKAEDGAPLNEDEEYFSSSRVNLQEDEETDPAAAQQGYVKKAPEGTQEAPQAPAPPPAAPAPAQSPADAMFPAEVANPNAPDMEGDPQNNVGVPTGDKPASPEGAADPKPEPEVAAAPVEEDKDDILADLIRVQHNKIDNLERVLSLMGDKLQQVGDQAAQVPSLVNQLDMIAAQVKEITPPAPLDSLNKMVEISDGIRIEDYWNSYAEKNHLENRLESNPYYNGLARKDKEGNLTLKSSELPELSPEQAKRSFSGEDIK